MAAAYVQSLLRPSQAITIDQNVLRGNAALSTGLPQLYLEARHSTVGLCKSGWRPDVKESPPELWMASSIDWTERLGGRLFGVEGLDLSSVALRDLAAPDFHRRGHLAIIVVQFFGQQPNAFHLLDAR